MSSNTKSKFLAALKIIFIIIYVLLTAFLAWGLIDTLTAPSENASLALGLYLAIVVIIFGLIGYAVSLITAAIGLIVAIVKHAGKGDVGFFIVAVILPIVTEGAFILICQLIA